MFQSHGREIPHRPENFLLEGAVGEARMPKRKPDVN